MPGEHVWKVKVVNAFGNSDMLRYSGMRYSECGLMVPCEKDPITKVAYLNGYPIQSLAGRSQAGTWGARASSVILVYPRVLPCARRVLELLDFPQP